MPYTIVVVVILPLFLERGSSQTRTTKMAINMINMINMISILFLTAGVSVAFETKADKMVYVKIWIQRGKGFTNY